MLEQGQEYSSRFLTQAKTELGDTMKRYPALRNTPVEPMLYVVMTDNWIEMTLRYVVEAWQRREVKRATPPRTIAMLWVGS